MPAALAISPLVLPEDEWQNRRRAHEARVRAWTDPHQERAARGEKHPVWDFLMEYYPYRPAWLRRWHPGPDLILGGAAARAYLRWPEYVETPEGVMLGLGRTEVQPGLRSPERASAGQRREFARWLRQLLAGMRDRPAYFGCHGLHEWAMVYRQAPEARRHSRWPLRLDAASLDRLVEQSTLSCTHFDAFRFFTAEARPLNRLQPERALVPQLEQKGCLHANMDLYKWSFKLAPCTPSELVADCFALAREIREVDMRASPYDFQALGFAPIAIETAAGRAEYETFQRDFAARAQPLRERLIALCERLV